MTARVTIGVLNYNYAAFLPAALDSALSQTHDDVEVVVVDDGSTDASAEVIRGYGNRVRPVLQPNGGQGSAMNAVWRASTGDIVMFLDADDLLHRDAAAAVAAAFSREPDTAWLMFRLSLIDATGAPLGRIRPQRATAMPNGDLRRHLMRFRAFHWQPTSGNGFSRTALDRVMPIPADEYRVSADAYLAGVVPLCGPVRSVESVLGSYRLHGANNYASVAVDEHYFRHQIARQEASHRHATEVARRLGVELPPDVRRPRDAAFIGFRLSSLLLDPQHHPYPDETRLGLARAGLTASLANPQLSWRNRLRRSAWFAACGAMPRALAPHLVAIAPDTPARRARLLRRRGR